MKKVTAKQLMIGDWVRYKGLTRKVEQLPMILDEYRIIFNSYINGWGCSSATPIPITEEWLKLNGFDLSPLTEKIIYGKSISKDCTIFHMTHNNISSIYITLYKKGSSDIECQTSIVNAKYIHQLQQAYRLACNKELKVKF